MTSPLRVLLVEDSPTDAKLVLQELRRTGRVIEFERVETADAMRSALERPWDVIVCDWSMPNFNAPAALAVLKESGLDLPFIIASGTIGEEHAVAAMRAGAHDYVLKDKLQRLAPAVEREIREYEARKAHRAAEAARAEAERRFRKLFESGIMGITVAEKTGKILEANDAFLYMLGYTRDDVSAGILDWKQLTPVEWRSVNAGVSKALDTRGSARPFEKEYLRKDGTTVPVLVGVAVLDGERTLTVVTDLTERKQAEAALRKSERRFSRLAESGIIGIAVADIFGKLHDANDAYLGMLGYTREELSQIPWQELTPPEWRQSDETAVEQLKEHGVASPWEKELFRKNGTRIPVLIGVAMLDHPKCIVFVADLTGQKHAETSLMERMRIATMTAEVGVALTRNATLPETLQGCCEALVKNLGASLSRIWTMNSATKSPELCASAESELVSGSGSNAKIDLHAVIAERMPYVTQDLPNDPRVLDADWVRREGMRSFAGHPFLVGGELLGGIGVFAREPFSDAALKAVASVADAIAVRIRGRLAEQANVALEEQLRQSQKMEAVGRLAGGIAHDFNNILSVILSYAELVIAELPLSDPNRDDIEEIHRAGLRAADLTRQLLMFSRQQVIAPKVLNLNEVLSSMNKMLQRLVGEDVDLKLVEAAELGRVHVDPGSIEQVIMNLAINARDAMPTGGKLTMLTANVVLDDAYAKSHLGAAPGSYVMLAIKDTGTGIDAETMLRIFEPFFTTKEKGKGTGLGLSTVFGIVQQGGGHIWVDTEPGKGTTFNVYLPRVDAVAHEVRSERSPTTLRGTETILLVEDEPQVRGVACSILRLHGYTVLDTSDVGEAIRICEKHEGPIHLLLSDVVMPQMSGPELAKRLVRVRTEMKVLCMSGYTDDAAVRHGALEGGFAYLQKPITVETLTKAVREAIDSTPNA